MGVWAIFTRRLKSTWRSFERTGLAPRTPQQKQGGMSDERCKILAGGEHDCDGIECDRSGVRALRLVGRGAAVNAYDAEVEHVIDLMRQTREMDKKERCDNER